MAVNKLPTITIGIPAYNEEANINALLEGVLTQQCKRCTVNEVIVISDNSSDKTNAIVSCLARTYPQLRLIIGHKRLGKSARLQQLFSLSSSDLFVGLDADIQLTHDRVIESLITPLLSSPKVGLAALNNQPYFAESWFEKVMNRLFYLWYAARVKVNGGDTIYNHQGMAFATRREVTSSVTFPRNLIADQHYLYIRVKELGYRFVFVASESVRFFSPATVHDFIIQGRRAVEEKQQLVHLMGKDIESYFMLPTRAVRLAVLMSLIKHPLLTPLSILAHFSLHVYLMLEHQPQTSATWEIPVSTKRTSE
jgi:glycosyltransferase involved in cell wall biosynthesis